jgi:N-acyl-D-amino-acid deacylase
MRVAIVLSSALLSFGSLQAQIASSSIAVRAEGQPFDIVIENGRIVDGTGSPWYSGQVGIRQGHIAAIGNLQGEPRRQTIDAHGQVVAPGFIDMLGQSELTMLVDPRLPSKIYQGITTEVTEKGTPQRQSTPP